MAIFADIQNALNKKLNALSGSPLIEWDNTKISPVTDRIYLHPSIISGDSTLRDVEGTMEHSGFLQIDIYTPLNKGTKNLTTWKDNIYSHFNGVNTLTEGGSTIYLRQIESGPSRREDAWYVGIISIYYTCYD